MTRFACRSDPGRTHANNQDRWFADDDNGMYFVTDGMANDIAPQIVVDRLPERLCEIISPEPDWADSQFQKQLQDSFQANNEEVYQAMADVGEIGLGATLVLALLRANKALLAHLGDSRIYLMREGELQQRTRDHSLVERLVDMGAITAEEAKNARGNGGPTRFLGKSDPVAADLQLLDLHEGDRLLLCSDGLTGMLTDEAIHAILAEELSLDQTCSRLVDAANDAGGLDNITAMIVGV